MHLKKDKNKIKSYSFRQKKTKSYLCNSIYKALESYIKHVPTHKKKNITTSFHNSNNNINTIENDSLTIDKESINPLSSIYTNTFYPHSYKNKNYIHAQNIINLILNVILNYLSVDSILHFKRMKTLAVNQRL